MFVFLDTDGVLGRPPTTGASYVEREREREGGPPRGCCYIRNQLCGRVRADLVNPWANNFLRFPARGRIFLDFGEEGTSKAFTRGVQIILYGREALRKHVRHLGKFIDPPGFSRRWSKMIQCSRGDDVIFVLLFGRCED